MNHSSSSSNSIKPIQIPRAPPRPPKYLIFTDNDSRTSIVEVNSNQKPNLSECTAFSDTKTKINGSNPSSYRGSFKNSRTDVKGSNIIDTSILRASEKQCNIAPSKVSKPSMNPQTPVPISSTGLNGIQAKGAPTIPPPQPVISPEQNAHGRVTEPLFQDVSNEYRKGADSLEISGTQDRDQSDIVGPDNPSLQINEEWTCYWDYAAGASYFYNHMTGEATWINPKL